MVQGLSQNDQGIWDGGELSIDPAPLSDTIPAPFGWPSQTGWGVDSVATSVEETPVGYNATTSISVDVGLYSAGGANFTAVPGSLNPGETVTLRHDTSPDPATPVVQTCTIGGVEGTFQTTTESPEVPAGAPIASGTFNPPNGRVGDAYTYGTVGLFTGGAPTSYSLNGTLPDGLNLNTSTGVISGTPTTQETLAGISVTGTNGTGSDTTNTADIAITIPGTASWQLPAGNFIPGRVALLAVFPRPDNETSSNARHRLAHSGFEYQIPIGVKSGAYPYRYTLTGGGNPAGATIGETLDVDGEGVQTPGEFYGVIRWSPPGSGTFNFEVTVEDQEGTQVVLTWSTVINDSKFTFMSNVGTPGGSGTISDPIDDWDTYYKGDANDATYQGQILVLRGGNYTMDGDGNTDLAAPNMMKITSSKSNGMIAYPGEVPVSDCSNSLIKYSNSMATDTFIAGLRLENGNNNMLNPRFIHLNGGRGDRCVFWKNYFKTIRLGINGASNFGCIWFDNTSVNPSNQYIYASQNEFEDIVNREGGTNGHLFDVYNCVDLLWERNEGLTDIDTQWGLWVKSSRSRNQIRGNIIHTIGNGITTGTWSMTAAGLPYHSLEEEICYNLIVAPSYSGSNVWSGFHTAKVDTQLFLYRNTFVGGKTKAQNVVDFNHTVDGNVVISDHSNAFSGSPPFWDTSIMDQIISSLTGDFASGIVDNSTGKLIGSNRTNYLGTHGFEIYGGT